MATTARSIIEDVMLALQETASVSPAIAGKRWTVAELARYFNDGQRAIVEVRPDAGTKTVDSHALAVGVKQTLPADAIKLFEVMGNANGAPVRLVDRKMLDAVAPGWRVEAGSTTISDYLYDEREPLAFEVYPPAANGAALKIRYAAYPVPIAAEVDAAVPADVADNMGLPDIFRNALREYILFRAKSKDAEFAPGVLAAAQQHLALCNAALGVEIKATTSMSPRAADDSRGRGRTTGP